MLNALTIDVEEPIRLSAFDRHVRREDRHRVRATFAEASRLLARALPLAPHRVPVQHHVKWRARDV